MIIQTNTSNVIKCLTYTERDAIKALANELDGNKEKVVISSAIAESIQVTKSVIVSAVRKIEIAGIIQSESRGHKGLNIVVLNQEALEIVAEGSGD